MSIKTPLNIWNDIERCWVMRMDLVIEGKTISGIHHTDFEDVVNDLDWVIRKLKRYQDEMASIYGEPILKYRPKELTHVYLMIDTSTGLIKIGRSIDPMQREKTLLSDKSSISLIFVSPLCHRKIEKVFHKKFAEKRQRGEWFRLDAHEVQQIKTFDYGS